MVSFLVDLATPTVKGGNSKLGLTLQGTEFIKTSSGVLINSVRKSDMI